MSFITVVKTYLGKALIRLQSFSEENKILLLEVPLASVLTRVKETCRSCIYFAAYQLTYLFFLSAFILLAL